MTFFQLAHVDVWLPLLAAIATGAIIGLERELATKSAGIRTHTLVCFSCALLMLIGVRQDEWLFDPIPGANVVSDPARMAHGILTGIGFLGAGVIFRQGTAVQGLTTAASIWTTASLGVLYGAGLWELAIAAAICTLVVLVIFRVFQFALPSRTQASIHVTLQGHNDQTDKVRAVLTDLCRDTEPFAVHKQADGTLALATMAWLPRRDSVSALSTRLDEIEGLTSYEITPLRVGDQVKWR